MTASTAFAAGAFVTVRVEGATRTIFEGPVLVEGRTITTETGGTHECNGTNNKAYPSSVPVPTAALADAAYLGRYYPSYGGFTFNAEWDPQYEDFFITRIAETTETSTEFWAIAVNDQLIPVGGCQFQLHNFDEVLFTLYGFNEEPFLKLTGPPIAISGRPITVKVTNGSNGEPIAGAVVAPAGSTAGAETNSNGEATVTFNHPGLTRLKASKPGSVRSNGLIVADL
ncbi:MAG TPA: carboxypeptidase-like regulatory domain-containing protein [Solirubrobacteraceae bacterium]|nr:carboxypeptidase-like regulatory domain-containing protein [Solirubrobacteraceae bacterium]